MYTWICVVDSLDKQNKNMYRDSQMEQLKSVHPFGLKIASFDKWNLCLEAKGAKLFMFTG